MTARAPRPRAAWARSLAVQRCVVYSIGSNGQDSFEREVQSFMRTPARGKGGSHECRS